jgi:type II secretory pathway component PulF
MKRFIYKAKRGLDEVVVDSIEAETQEEALNILVAGGFTPFFIEQEGPETSPVARRKSSFAFPGSRTARVRSGDVLAFTRKLTTLIRARVELLSALHILYEQYEPSRLKEITGQMYAAIKEGNTFSLVLENFPEVFTPFYVSMVQAGEASGRLDLSLEQIGEFLSQQERLRSKVALALAYPIMLVCVGAVSIFVLINFVIPKLSGLLLSIRGDLPLVTRWILFISEVSQKTSIFALPAIAGAVIFLFWKKNAAIRSGLVMFLKKLPVVRNLFLNQELANFSWSLSLLIRSGVPLYQSLKVSSKNIGDVRMTGQLENVCEQLRFGETLSRALQKQTTLPGFFIKMIAIGEESGKLPDVLSEISASCTQDVESSLALISALMEPCLILILGSVMGVIVFSIMLPLFQVTQGIG